MTWNRKVWRWGEYVCPWGLIRHFPDSVDLPITNIHASAISRDLVIRVLSLPHYHTTALPSVVNHVLAQVEGNQTNTSVKY